MASFAETDSLSFVEKKIVEAGFCCLDTVCHSALRFITGDIYGTHCRATYNKVGWSPFAERRNEHWYLFIYLESFHPSSQLWMRAATRRVPRPRLPFGWKQALWKCRANHFLYICGNHFDRLVNDVRVNGMCADCACRSQLIRKGCYWWCSSSFLTVKKHLVFEWDFGLKPLQVVFTF